MSAVRRLEQDYKIKVQKQPPSRGGSNDTNQLPRVHHSLVTWLPLESSRKFSKIYQVSSPIPRASQDLCS